MNKTMSVALLVGGIVLLVFGYNAAQSASSAFSRVFTGSPTNKAVWMISAGAIATVVGLVGISRGGK